MEPRPLRQNFVRNQWVAVFRLQPILVFGIRIRIFEKGPAIAGPLHGRSRVASDHAAGVERRDLVFRVAQVRQHLVTVLAQQR